MTENENVCKPDFVQELHKPVLNDGKELTELTFNFSGLTGNDFMEIEAERMAANHLVIVPTTDSAFLVRLAARACQQKVGPELFGRLDLRDFHKIRSAAANFMASTV